VRKNLSQRETQVLRGLVDGKKNKDVAVELGITERTVEAHRARLMLKLQLGNVSELVRYAIAHGIIQPLIVLSCLGQFYCGLSG
jgi:two-component system, LuxR family, response regulator FixJ